MTSTAFAPPLFRAPPPPPPSPPVASTPVPAGVPRARLLAGLRGTVVEIGAGTGATFAAYPAQVSRVLAIEPEARHRAAAERAAATARVPITVLDGLADRLPLSAHDADAVVCSQVLCTVPDVAAALAEIRRVLRPGGELRFFEHVIAESGPVRVVQRLAGLLWPRVADGCHPDRDTVAAITAAGLVIERIETFGSRHPRWLAPVPRVLGAARA